MLTPEYGHTFRTRNCGLFACPWICLYIFDVIMEITSGKYIGNILFVPVRRHQIRDFWNVGFATKNRICKPACLYEVWTWKFLVFADGVLQIQEREGCASLWPDEPALCGQLVGYQKNGRQLFSHRQHLRTLFLSFWNRQLRWQIKKSLYDK